MILCFTLLQFPVRAAFPAFDADEGVLIWEANSGNSVYEQHADNRYYPASTTKLMTALLLCENVPDWNAVVTVGEEVHDYGWEDSTADLELNQQLTYRDLLNAMLIPSGNDAAGTIAVNIGRILLGDPNADKDTAQAAFINQMNEKAQSLGLINTHFVNPHGMHNPEHYTTPRDMSVIAKEVFKYEEARKAASTQLYTLKDPAGVEYQVKATNHMLYPTATVRATDLNPAAPPGTPDQTVPNGVYTDLLTAAKTGSTDEAGRTFVFYSKQGDADIVGVLFKTGDEAIFTQTKAVLDELHANYATGVIGDKSDGLQDSIPLTNVHFNNDQAVELGTDRVVTTYDQVSKLGEYTTDIRWDEDYVAKDENGELSLVSAIKPGTKLGAVLVSKGDQVMETVPIYARNELNVKNWQDFVHENILWFAIGLLVVVISTLSIIVVIKDGKSKRVGIKPSVPNVRTGVIPQSAARKKTTQSFMKNNIDSKY